MIHAQVPENTTIVVDSPFQPRTDKEGFFTHG
jgi:hypothetical protein